MMENPIKMDDLGVPFFFLETPINASFIFSLCCPMTLTHRNNWIHWTDDDRFLPFFAALSFVFLLSGHHFQSKLFA